MLAQPQGHRQGVTSAISSCSRKAFARKAVLKHPSGERVLRRRQWAVVFGRVHSTAVSMLVLESPLLAASCHRSYAVRCPKLPVGPSRLLTFKPGRSVSCPFGGLTHDTSYVSEAGLPQIGQITCLA
jgi:hypothetical protein